MSLECTSETNCQSLEFSAKPAGETTYGAHLFAILLNVAICETD